MAARAQPGQLCAGLRTIPRQAANDRRSQCTVSIPFLTPGYSGGFRTKGWQQKGGRMVTVRPPAATDSNGFNKDVRVVDTRPHRRPQHNRERPNDENGPVIIDEGELDNNFGQSAADIGPAGPNAAVTVPGPQSGAVVASTVDKGTKVASNALDTIGNVLSGMELQLELGLKELTIKELVLRDLGLVLELKTAPKDKKPEPELEPEPESQE